MSTNLRLLIISYHFPPDGAIGGMRWSGFAKYLARLGWEVHVITASAAAGQNAVDGVHVHVHHRRRTLNDFYNALAARFKGEKSQPVAKASGAGESPASNRPSSPVRRVGSTVRRTAGAWLAFPDFGRGWVLRAAGAARTLLKSKRFALVITSGPPHSVHLAGVLATLGRREPLWIDMRDPWSDAVLAHTSDKTTRFLIPRFEQFVRRHAQRAIVTTAEFAATLRLAAPQLAVSHVSNGVDLELLPARQNPPASGFVISYVGTLYGRRSLTAVLAAISDLVRDHPEIKQSFKFHIAGNIDAAHLRGLESDLATGDIANLVEIHGVVSRAVALELLNSSHLALVLAQDQHLMIPAKLYESIALGVPTLVVAETTSAAARESRRIGGFIAGSNDVKAIKAVLESTMARRTPARVTSGVPISHQQLAAQLDQLFRERVGTEATSDPRPSNSGTSAERRQA